MECADWRDLNIQFAYVDHELQNHETGALKALRSATTVDEATAAMIGYERPAGWSAANPRGGHGWGNRLGWAQKIFDGGGDMAAAPARPPAPMPAAGALPQGDQATVYGQAFNKAAENAYSWRLAGAIDQEIEQAYSDNPDDVAGFEAALEGARERFAKDPNLADPRYREIMTRRLTERAQAFRGNVYDNQLKKARADEAAAADEHFAGAEAAISRRAYVLAGRAAAGPALEAEIGRAGTLIDDQLDNGAITAGEAQRRKRALATVGAQALMRGQFDKAPDLASRERMVREMIPAWERGEGALAQLDFDTVSAVQRELGAAAARERSELDKANIEARAELKSAIDDDVASIRRSGTPLMLGERELSPADVAAVLGPVEANKWAEDRIAAQRFYAATADFETMPDADILAAVERLQPAPGMQGYAAAEKLAAEAERAAAGVIKARREDPALAVQNTFRGVAERKAALDPGDPRTYEALAKARLGAQGQIGIPELARRPLTRDEARAIALEITSAENQAGAATDIARRIDQRYGTTADEVMAQVLEQTGIDADLKASAARFIRRLGLGERAAPPAMPDDGAGAAVSGEAPVVFKDVPTTASILKLRDNPGLAAQFDARFGAGTADFYLNPRGQRAVMPKTEGSGDDGRGN